MLMSVLCSVLVSKCVQTLLDPFSAPAGKDFICKVIIRVVQMLMNVLKQLLVVAVYVQTTANAPTLMVPTCVSVLQDITLLMEPASVCYVLLITKILVITMNIFHIYRIPRRRIHTIASCTNNCFGKSLQFHAHFHGCGGK